MDPPLSLKGVVGIQNMGNMCYVNAILQLLRTCQELSMFCLTQSDQLANKKVILAYKDILATIWSAYKPAYVRPLAFISEIGRAVQNTPYDMFGHHMQQDAHEYVSYLLDQFHEELSIPVVFESEEKTMDSKRRLPKPEKGTGYCTPHPPVSGSAGSSSCSAGSSRVRSASA